MKKVLLLVALAVVLGLAALVACAYGPQLEFSGVPADIQALYMKGARAKWRMIGGLIGLVAALVAVLAGVLWLSVRRKTES